MEPARGYAGGSALGVVSGGAVPPKQQPTISERLGAAAQGLENLCNRAQFMLERVNGTPPGAGNSIPDKAKAIPPMISAVEQIENQVSRLSDLVNSLEQVA